MNILEPAFNREEEIQYKHYHLEITATNDQEMNLKRRLLVSGLAIDIKPFHFTKHQEAGKDNDVQGLQSHCESEGNFVSLALWLY